MKFILSLIVACWLLLPFITSAQVSADGWEVVDIVHETITGRMACADADHCMIVGSIQNVWWYASSDTA